MSDYAYRPKSTIGKRIANVTLGQVYRSPGSTARLVVGVTREGGGITTIYVRDVDSERIVPLGRVAWSAYVARAKLVGGGA